MCVDRSSRNVPHGSGLQLNRRTGQNGSGQDLAFFATVHYSLRNGCECPDDDERVNISHPPSVEQPRPYTFKAEMETYDVALSMCTP